jgi:hypothetical protein
MANTKRFVVEERTPQAWHLVDTVVTDAETGERGKVIWAYATKKEATAAARERNTTPLYDLVGTAEAAKILDVERPRIGRWKKTGLLPPPILELATGPIWLRKDIVALTKERESRRRQRGGTEAAVE